MTRDPRKFSELLTQAIRKISFESDRKIGVLQDEIGIAMGQKDGSNIIYWRSKEKIPSHDEDIANLARELVKRGKFGKAWLEEFLTAADYFDIVVLCEEIFPTLSEDDVTEALEGDLPLRMYGTLVGRKAHMNEIIGILRDENSRWMVAIDGMGGIGKSAIAIEIGHRSIEDRLFEKVIWISAARGISSGFTTSLDTEVTYNSILNKIVTSFGFPDMIRLSIQEKIKQIRKLLHTRRTLIILDNMDTASEPQNQITQHLLPILIPSKVLLTSRHRFSGELYQIHLRGLETAEAKSFLQQEAINKNIPRLSNLDSKNLDLIIHATGGSPLAMKLVGSQLHHMSVEVTLDYLRKVKPLHNNSSEDSYIKFYQGIFMPSWERLTFDSQKLLLAMTQFPLDHGGPIEAIKTISELDDNVLNKSLSELWRFSFLEVTHPDPIRTIYYMHPLTYNFVLADLAKMSK